MTDAPLDTTINQQTHDTATELQCTATPNANPHVTNSELPMEFHWFVDGIQIDSYNAPYAIQGSHNNTLMITNLENIQYVICESKQGGKSIAGESTKCE